MNSKPEHIITLEHEGMCIHNPFMDETGRFPTTPEYYGFVVHGRPPHRMWRLTTDAQILCIDERKGGNHILTCYSTTFDENGERAHPTISHTLNEAIEAFNKGEL